MGEQPEMHTVAMIRKRENGNWQAVIRMDGKVPMSKTFKLKLDAEKWADKTEAELEGGYAYRIKEAENTLVADVLERFRLEVVPKRGGSKWDNNRLLAMKKTAWAQLHLREDIHGALVAWRDERLNEVSAGTVSRDFNLLGPVFEKAMKEWKLIAFNPAHMVERPANDDEPREFTWDDAHLNLFLEHLTWDEDSSPLAIARRHAALPVPGESPMARRHVHPKNLYGQLGWTVALLRHTGLRLGNVPSMLIGWIKLGESHIAFPARLAGRKTNENARAANHERRQKRGKAVMKNGKGFLCPLNPTAARLLGKLVAFRTAELREKGLSDAQIALQPLMPNPPYSIGSCLRQEQLALAKLRPDMPLYEVLTRHDLRHTYTTELARTVKDGMDLMKVTGRSDMKSLARYINHSVDRLVDLVSQPAPGTQTPLPTDVSAILAQMQQLQQQLIAATQQKAT